MRLHRRFKSGGGGSGELVGVANGDDYHHDDSYDDARVSAVVEDGHLRLTKSSSDDSQRRRHRVFKHKRSSVDVDLGADDNNNNNTAAAGGSGQIHGHLTTIAGADSGMSPLLPLPPPPPPPQRRRRRYRGGAGGENAMGYSDSNKRSSSSSSTRSSYASSIHRLLPRIFMTNPISSMFIAKRASKQQKQSESSQQYSTLIVAVLLWYSLGVISISTSKLLLTAPATTDRTGATTFHGRYDELQVIGGLPPLFLTLQQLILGCTFLKFLINIQFLGLSTGLRPIIIDDGEDILLSGEKNNNSSHNTLLSASTTAFLRNGRLLLMSGSKNCDTNRPVIALRFLILAGICFSLGFLTTNLAFGAASPAFVETIKAAEPITSAILAVTYGIEKLTGLEISSLGGIVTGVLISTLASSSSTSSSIPSSSASLLAAIIVMTSNLCFSLRGLYQKMHQRSIAASTKKSESSVPSTNGTGDPATATVVIPSQLDDLNLQFRMQQTGVAMLLIPTLFFDGPRLFYHSWQMTMHLDAKSFRAVIFRYILLSTANGLAFSSYNLASTYLLTRISVVHHAALNCTRRIFAIVCTSIIFGIPISFVSGLGIALSFLSFMIFTTAKAAKNKNDGGSNATHSKANGFDKHDDNARNNNYMLPMTTRITQSPKRN